MPILKNYRKLLTIIIIPQILNVFLITSCNFQDFQKHNDCYFNNKKNQLKTLIIPKGINSPNKNKEYEIPYKEKDLEKENYDIFPPI